MMQVEDTCGGAMEADGRPVADDARSAAFAELFASTHRRVLGYVRRAGATAADADDVVADVYVVAWRRLDDIPQDDPVPWLLGVARNVVRNQQRSRRRSDTLLARLRTEPPPAATTSTDARDDVSALRRALAQLSTTDRDLLQLAAVEDLTPAQIAQVLGCRAVTARVRLHRARTRLRALLDRGASAPATTAAHSDRRSA